MKQLTAIVFAVLLLSACSSSAEKAGAVDTSATTTEAVTVPDVATSTVLPSSSTDVVKAAIEGYASGDLTSFTANMDDNIKFYFPAPGDSLVGKQAVLDYFTKRRALADSIQIVNPIYLGINNKTNAAVAQGDWLMSWYSFMIKYKNGKRVFLPVHTVQHMNSAGKADIMAMYYDMHRVMAAAK